MAESIFDMFTDIFSAVGAWLNTLFAKTGMLPILLGMFVLACIFKFFVLPIVGGNALGGSDRVRPVKNGLKSRSQSNSKSNSGE